MVVKCMVCSFRTTLCVTGSIPVLTTNVIRLTAKNGINEEYYKWLQTLMIYKWVNSIITLNSQVAELVDARFIV